jgi:hypothetical protein
MPVRIDQLFGNAEGDLVLLGVEHEAAVEKIAGAGRIGKYRSNNAAGGRTPPWQA